MRKLRRLLKYFGINALGKRAYAFYVEPWLTQLPFHTLRMLADLEEFSALKPLMLKTSGKSPVLVFAPHQDDEIIGAGGSLIKHVQRGDRVRVVYLTDGGFADIAVSDYAETGEYVRRRDQEARWVCEALGASEPTFYAFENELTVMWSQLDDMAQRMARDIDQDGPGVVYIPFFLDNHPIHRLSNIALARAIRGLGHSSFQVCGCSVWSLMPTNVAVDIMYELPKKMALLSLYSSQYPILDYMNWTEGMNRYQTRLVMRTDRSGAGLGAVECFFRLPARDYADIVLNHADDMVGMVGLETS
jgi:LmbE family N-acetylglucosaminyl deacetylase